MDDRTSTKSQRGNDPDPSSQPVRGLGRPLSKAAIAAEYASLGFSVAGTVSAFIYKQAAYAAAPISISLFLSLLNRQRLNRQLAQQAELAAQQAQVLNQFGEEFAPLPDKVAGLQGEVEAQAQIERDRPDFARQIQGFQNALPDLASQAQLEQLHAEFSGQLSPLTQQLAEAAEAAELQRQALQALQQQLLEGNTRLDEWEERLNGLEEAEGDRPDFASQIGQLRRAISAHFQSLKQLTQEAASRSDTQQLQAELAQQKDLSHGLSEQVRQLQIQLEGYLQVHEQQHQDLSVSSLGQIDELAQRLSWLEQQLDPLPAIEPEPSKVEPEPPTAEPEPEAQIATLFLNLGIDFGTRFTKVCFQNLSDEQSEIIPFRDEAPTLSDALLLSQIGVLPDGRLLAGLSESQWQELQLPGVKIVDGLKMRLADLDLGQTQVGWRLEAFPELDEPEMVENLCAYYLSRVIQKSQAWVRENHPQLVANEIIGWSANVGVPVPYCDEQPVSDRFQRVLTLAWLLSNEPQTQALTIELLQEQMIRLRTKLEQPTNCHSVPEIAAESWSFLNSRQAGEGYYLFFDIGDGTLDGCAFHYERQNDGEPNVEFYYAKVSPLGVRSIAQALSQEIGLSLDEINELFRNQPGHNKLTQSQQRRVIQKMMANVIVQGGQEYAAHHPGEKIDMYKKKLHVFLGGGGSQIPFFKQLPKETYQDFGHHSLGIQGYKTRTLSVHENIEMNGIQTDHSHRFAVALGLAADYANLAPAISLPNQMKREKPRMYSVNNVNQPIKFEDTKDAM